MSERLGREARRLLGRAQTYRACVDGEGAVFGEPDEMALVEELNAHQERYERGVEGASASAMPKGAVLDVLGAFGWSGGYDETATALFFGEEGTRGFTDGEGEYGAEFLGGFVFDAPDGSRYVLSCLATGRKNGRGRGGPAGGGGEERGKRRGGPKGALVRNLLRRGLGRGERIVRRPPAPGARWSIERAGWYVVEPNFLYEKVTIQDLVSGGLLDSYPIEDPERKVDPHEGSVEFARAREAISFSFGLEEAMRERGVLCRPEVVLERGGAPLLPKRAAREHERRAEEGRARKIPAQEDGEAARPSPRLGRHAVRRRLSPLVPSQEEAERLGEQASYLSMLVERRDELARRVKDERIPGHRRGVLVDQLAQAEVDVAGVLEKLDVGTGAALSGLVLSLVCELGEWRFPTVIMRRERDEDGHLFLREERRRTPWEVG